MISRDNKFIFIHINKTGGTSIRKALHGWHLTGVKIRPPAGVSQYTRQAHWTYNEYKKYCGKSFDHYFKFTVVRNPWDRVVSWYEHTRTHYNRKRDPEISPFKEWVITNYGNNNYENRMFNPCAYWLGDNMDFIARFENLDEDFKKICKALDIKQELGHHRYNGFKERKPYQSYYDDETREIIRNRFAEDIDAFDYEFDTNIVIFSRTWRRYRIRLILRSIKRFVTRIRLAFPVPSKALTSAKEFWRIRKQRRFMKEHFRELMEATRRAGLTPPIDEKSLLIALETTPALRKEFLVPGESGRKLRKKLIDDTLKR